MQVQGVNGGGGPLKVTRTTGPPPREGPTLRHRAARRDYRHPDESLPLPAKHTVFTETWTNGRVASQYAALIKVFMTGLQFAKVGAKRYITLKTIFKGCKTGGTITAGAC